MIEVGYRIALRTAILLLVQALLLGCDSQQPSERLISDQWSKRDGRTEAIDDLKIGWPLKLFWHADNQIDPRSIVPGIEHCPGKYDFYGAKASRGAKLFRHLPDADSGETGFRREENVSRQEAAARYAKDYNMTVLRIRTSELRLLCPAATISEEGWTEFN
jgi:hypothetical protein